jgi:hypothetical protein
VTKVEVPQVDAFENAPILTHFIFVVQIKRVSRMIGFIIWGVEGNLIEKNGCW